MKDFVLVVRPLPDGVPPAVRVRRALKSLLRSFKLRAVEIRELPACIGGAAACPCPSRDGGSRK